MPKQAEIDKEKYGPTIGAWQQKTVHTQYRKRYQSGGE
jgi:hypothetical protein